jgi:glycosyltransferase involved in cell wall biosynthesis
VAITDAERSQFLPYAVDPALVTVIPNGIWIDDFSEKNHQTNYRANLGINREPVILFVGRLNTIKGPDILLEAFGKANRTVPHARLLYAGPDEGMRQHLVRRAKELGLSRQVHFLGYLAHPDKLAAYSTADIVVVPSRSEAMSLVALEAGACAKPVVLTDRCGFDEVAAAGGGIVVPADPDAICGALVTLLNDAILRNNMGANLKQLVESRYTWPGSAQQYLDLFTSIKRRLH